MGLRLNPLTQRKLRRFREIRRGYWSFLVLVALVVLSLGAELLINSRALAVRYQGRWYFPTYSAVKLGADFGLEGPAARTPVNYRALKAHFEAAGGGDRVILPPVPYDPFENDAYEGVFKPAPPSRADQALPRHRLDRPRHPGPPGLRLPHRDPVRARVHGAHLRDRHLARLPDGLVRRRLRPGHAARDRGVVEHPVPLHGDHRVLGDPVELRGVDADRASCSSSWCCSPGPR